MLMESATRCDRVTLLKRDRDLEPELELEPEQKRLKSEQEPKLTSETNESDDNSLEKQVKSEQEPKLTSDSDESDDDSLEKRVKSEQEPKLTSETNESDSDESDSDESHSVKYHGDFFEKYKAREEADKVYREKSRGLSRYDAIHRPRKSLLCGISYVRPLIITEEYFPVLQRLSNLALDYYKEVSGASFEFHGIVKCTYNFNSLNSRPRVHQIINYYITFGAKAKGHPAVIIFRAKVSEDQLHKDKQPSVEECNIHHAW